MHCEALQWVIGEPMKMLPEYHKATNWVQMWSSQRQVLISAGCAWTVRTPKVVGVDLLSTLHTFCLHFPQY